MITASRMVTLVQRELERSNAPLRVYWHEMSEGSRTEYARELVSLRGTVPVVPIVLGSDLFHNANAMLSDLNILFGQNREVLSDIACDQGGGLCVMLLTRSRLAIPQVSSPVVLPDWFPVRAGTEVHVRLMVFGDAVDVVLLNADEARVERLSELLYELEAALAERVESVCLRRSADGDRLFQRFNGLMVGGGKRREDLFAEWRSHLAGTKNRRAYRPSVRNDRSLVSLILRLVLKSSPDEMAKLGRALAEAAGIGGDGALRPPLLSVLFRPSGERPPGARVGHAMLLAIYGAYQFITGAAHAGEYPEFSLNLIHSTSRDLCTTLQDSAELVRSLSATD